MNAIPRHARIREEIIHRLQSMVHSDHLKPGDRLPPERQLSVLLGVSRNSVREAIKSLEQQGMLVSRPGAGTYLTENQESDPGTALGKVFSQERHRIADIFELRLILEPQIAHLAAQRVRKDELTYLQKLTELYEEAIRSELPTLDFDQNFHDAIASATGNHAIIKLMDAMHEVLRESRDVTLQSSRRTANSLRDHVRILDALKRGDAHAAQHAMYEHLENTQNIVFTSTFGE
jgi:GntR family transcriptional repressor for pyruvate dehydrogenase complex